MAASRNRLSTDLLSRVGRFLADHVTDGRLALGLSGGIDSVVLLHLLSRLLPAGQFAAIHVNHGLSPNADRWVAFCRDRCASLNIPLSVVPVQVSPTGGGIEAAARLARYQAFSDSGFATILLAQHRADQAETLLFNLLRGAGLHGAAAMRPAREHGALRILRPLLDVSKAEIRDYAQQHSLTWIDDESNDDRRFSRNFLRHEVLTAIAPRFPGGEAALARAATHFAEAADLLDELAENDWQDAADGDAARLEVLRQLSSARLKNLLRWRLRQLGWRVPDSERLTEFARQLLTAAVDRHPCLNLPEGTMRLSRGRLTWLACK